MTGDGPELSALILAGGRARRMGGRKPELELGGRSLVEHAHALAVQVADEVLLLAGAREGLLPTVRRVPDWPDVAGPLGALGAGLEAARHDWSLLLSCDMPFVESSLVERLRVGAARLSVVDVVVPVVHGQRQPFPGLYHRRVAAQARVTALTGSASLLRLLERVAVVEVPVDAAAARRLWDLDTPAELQAARAELRS